MAKQQINRLKKFPEVPGMDKELDLIVRQILDNIIDPDPALGELYTNADAAIVLTMAVINTDYLVTGYIKGKKNKVVLSEDSIRIIDPGIYKAHLCTSFTHSINNTQCHAHVTLNGVHQENVETERKIGTAGDFGAMSCNGYVEVKASDVLQVKFASNKTGDLTINHINFNIEKKI